MKAKFTQTISDMNQELRLAQDEARRHKRETELSEQKLLDFKKTLTQSKEKLLLQVGIQIYTDRLSLPCDSCRQMNRDRW